MESLLPLLILQNIPNLGDGSIKKLIQQVGSAEGVLKEKKSNLLKIEGIGMRKIENLHNPIHLRNAEKELKFIENEKLQITAYDQQDYPKRLKECIDAPVILFSSGNTKWNNKQPIISIVGTRKITSYGQRFCEKLIQDLKYFDPIIVSGFAYGVDITAHNCAVKEGLQTIACVAHGLNQIYPKSHKKYMRAVEENGGFVTEFWSTSELSPKNFLSRNRIIAGMSEATIVIESGERGGSLVTAEIANSYYRDVFAVPGRTNDVYSKGCNMLIKSQQAHMLNGIEDLVYILNWNKKKEQKNIQKQLFIDLTPKEQIIFDYLQTNGKSNLDDLSITTKIPTYQLAGMLIALELKGVVSPLPGKVFELV